MKHTVEGRRGTNGLGEGRCVWVMDHDHLSIKTHLHMCEGWQAALVSQLVQADWWMA